ARHRRHDALLRLGGRRRLGPALRPVLAGPGGYRPEAHPLVEPLPAARGRHDHPVAGAPARGRLRPPDLRVPAPPWPRASPTPGGPAPRAAPAGRRNRPAPDTTRDKVLAPGRVGWSRCARRGSVRPRCPPPAPAGATP